MCGAPEGELYDVTLLQDNEISPYNGNVIDELIMLINKSGLYNDNNDNNNNNNNDSSSGTWADKYALVEFIRRVLLHHIDNLILEFQQRLIVDSNSNSNSNDNNQNSFMITLTDATVDALQSLRSSTVRNGLLCARSIIKNYSKIPWSDTQLQRIVTDLVNRTTVGPRFICEQAGEVLTNLTTSLPPLTSILILVPSIGHKNADACSKVYSLIAESSLQLNEIVYEPSSSLSSSTCIMKKLVDSLSKGLNAKRPQARDLCRKAFRHIQIKMGNDAFQSMLNGFLISHKAIEVNREIDSLIKSELSLVSVFDKPNATKHIKKSVKTNAPTSSSFREKLKTENENKKQTLGECSIVTNNDNNDKNKSVFDMMEI